MTFSLSIQTAADLAAEAREAVNHAVTQHIEAAARARGYDGAAQLASYAASTVPEWAAEARAFVAWRDACWLAIHALPDTTTKEAALAALPAQP